MDYITDCIENAIREKKWITRLWEWLSRQQVEGTLKQVEEWRCNGAPINALVSKLPN